MRKKPTPTSSDAVALKFDTVWLIVIALMATAVRVVFAIDSKADPFNGLLFLDAKVYHLLASEIANSDFWGSEVFFRAPLFPYLLGITYKLFGMGQSAIKVINAGMGVATAFLTYFIAEIHFNRRVARIAGICVALYPTLYFFESSLMPTALEVFTFTLSVFFLSRYEVTGKQLHLGMAGFALALAVLARPTILSFVVLLPYWLWLIAKDRDWAAIGKKLVWLATPLLLVVLSATVRNYVIEQDLVLVSSQGGANFYIGNNENADGQTVAFPTGQTPLDKHEDHIWSASQFLAEQQLKRQLTAAEVSDFWLDRGMKFIKDQPGAAIGLFLKKAYLYFCGEELFNNSNPIMPRSYSALYSLSLWRFGLNFPYGLLAPLFLIGIIMLLRRKNKRSLLLLFALSYVAAIVLFFISSRFRQPLIPVMIVIAAFAVVEIYDWLRARRWRSFVPYCVALVLLVFA
ncbi:MAG: glycosyltransferase family 39 protein, partial [Candidatus Zixiibacteriota bacterium]